jgi:16S rRNA (guanine1207-N2)-methyltransferase
MTESYYTWQTFETSLAGEAVRWAGKPGLESWNEVRPSTRLIAEALSVEPSQRVLDLHCGVGVCGVLAARRGADVTLCDDSIVAVQAAQRTLDLNGASGTVIHDNDVAGIARGGPAHYDLVLLDAPRGREWMRHLLAVAAWVLRPGGRLMLAGPNRGGIKGFIEDANEIVGPCQVTGVKAGHRLAVATRSAAVGAPSVLPAVNHQTCEAIVRGQPIRFVTRPGVFSQYELDAGTRVLIEAMDARPGEAVLDLGCGSGVVGMVAAQMGGQVVCVDSSAAALAATHSTLDLNGVTAQVLASDCALAVRDMRFDVVATNPPFHQGLGAEYEVARQFVHDAAQVLKDSGRLYLVANRFIRYERVMEGLFFEIRTAYEDNRFRVLATEGRMR